MKGLFVKIRDKIVSAWKGFAGFMKKAFCEYIPNMAKRFVKFLKDLGIIIRDVAVKAWRGLGNGCKALWAKTLSGLTIVWKFMKKVFRGFVNFWRAFPRNFVWFWKTLFWNVVNFFRYLPRNIKGLNKDKVIDLAVGTGAVVVWCTPVFVVVFVLTWFLMRNL